MVTAKVTTSGHFGELLQGRLGPDGPLALITLPCPALAVSGTFAPGPDLSVSYDGPQILTQDAMRAFITGLVPGQTGQFRLSAQMPPGGGAGASTAALVTLARLCGVPMGMELAQACVAAEGASDPLMLPQPERLLWASRRAELLLHLPPLPRFDIVGGFFGPDQRTDPADLDFPDITPLVQDWQAAEGDLAQIASISTQSATATLAARGISGDPTLAVARDLGALGIVIAHTGSARGALFAPGTAPLHSASALAEAGFRQIVQFSAGSA